jgi:hypothetical protein
MFQRVDMVGKQKRDYNFNLPKKGSPTNLASQQNLNAAVEKVGRSSSSPQESTT